ncbi:MAG: SAM-dependent methyltransferase [Acidimicrobiia bacterium]|nr:SAM-dependent methyltransferase [Acidimicrobiia bacterium]NNL68810.1 hypothetical protein [Acidimicrobiia bacterium]
MADTAAASHIRSAIGEGGPMPFDEFMERALYGPGGFFAGDELRSEKAGDFLTSPEVSPWFGRMFGRFVARERARLGEPFRLVEVGAGSGSLLAGLLAECDVEAWAVERSPAARQRLAQVVAPGQVVEEMGDALGRGVVIANELLDNLPMAIAVRRGDGWSEQLVADRGGTLAIVEEPARPAVGEWADQFSGPVEEGDIVEVQLQATRWVAEVLAAIGTGSLVIIDYGATAEELEPRRAKGTLRTYRSHHLGPDPLLEPGATDITADVNFTAVMAAAREAGAAVELHRQDDFLSELGLRDVVSQLRREELDLARSGDELARLKIRSDLTDIGALLNPRGLGDFRIVVARV